MIITLDPRELTRVAASCLGLLLVAMELLGGRHVEWMISSLSGGSFDFSA